MKAEEGDQATMVVGALFDGARDLAAVIPVIGHAVHAVNAIYDTAFEIAEIVSHSHDDSQARFQTTVAKAGTDLANRLQDAQNTLTGSNNTFNGSITAVIAADYGKLRTVGECRRGNSDVCPDRRRDWEFNSDELTRIGWGLRAALRNIFYSTLLPAKYKLWYPVRRGNLKFTNARTIFGSGPFTGDRFPFAEVPGSAEFARPWCRVLSDHALDEWQVYALGRRTGEGVVGNLYGMEVPKPSVTDPLFAPIDPAKYPEGGLGNDKEAFYLRYFERAAMEYYPFRDTPIVWKVWNPKYKVAVDRPPWPPTCYP